jgi:hypothetical protein
MSTTLQHLIQLRWERLCRSDTKARGIAVAKNNDRSLLGKRRTDEKTYPKKRASEAKTNATEDRRDQSHF